MVSFLVGAIALATVFLFGCVGEIITEKAGHLNLGIPGIMCVGTAGGCYAVSLYMRSLTDPKNASWLLMILFSILLAALFAAALGGIYGLLTVTLRCNQNITGLSVTIFGNGFAQFFMDTCVLTCDQDRANFEQAGKIISKGLPFADSLGAFGKIFLSYGFLVYLAIIIALIASFVLNKTRVGLHLRAVGENPATADAAGINVSKYKYMSICIGGAIAGLGGLYYLMEISDATWNKNLLGDIGWLAIALVIFTIWKPNFAIFASYLFGGLLSIGSTLPINTKYQPLIDMLPYLMTIILLVFTSIRNKKESQPPASLGLPYFREER